MPEKLPRRERRRGHEIFERPDALVCHRGRGVAQFDRVMDSRGCACGQEAGREQVPLARRQQPPCREDVHILVDEPADEHQQVVLDARRLRPARRHEVLHHPASRRGGAHRLLLDVGAGRGRPCSCAWRPPEHHRDEGSGDERDEELPVEARSHIAQQRGGFDRPSAGGAHDRVSDEEEKAGAEREQRDLGEVEQVAERGHDREPQRVDAAPIVQQVHVVPFAAAIELGPERAAAPLHAREDVVGQGPRGGARRVDGPPAPAVHRVLHAAFAETFGARRSPTAGAARRTGSGT
jgi:hypothetical protein